MSLSPSPYSGCCWSRYSVAPPRASNTKSRGALTTSSAPSSLLAERATLAAALATTAPPKTFKGIKALAQAAMTLVEAQRTPEDQLLHPEDIVEWMVLRALSSAAGKPEAIPLPALLPDYWPA